MTKKELSQAIKNHDHHWQFSDDHRVWSGGRAHRDMILEELEKMFNKKSERLIFWNEHAPKGSGYAKSYIQELIDNGN